LTGKGDSGAALLKKLTKVCRAAHYSSFPGVIPAQAGICLLFLYFQKVRVIKKIAPVIN
jgi:hypothetical protein